MIRWVALVVAGAALVALPGCGDDGGDDLTITLDEWSIEVTPSATDSGKITMSIDNVGGFEHQLLIVPAPSGNLPALPTGEADLAAAKPMDRIEAFGRGRFQASFLRILPGDYVLLCNLVTGGVAHYAKGMSASLTVNSADEVG